MIKSKLFVLLLGFVSFFTNAQVSSTFETDADGWTFLNTSTSVPVAYSSTGGNPGGFASVTYSSNTATTTQNWIAPSKFLGNLLVKSFGMNLKFDMQQSLAGTNSNTNGDIRIESGSTILVFSLPTKPAVIPAWSSYSITLDETTPWRMGSTDGALATRAQIKSVMSNVTSIEIRGTYATNASYVSGLDNVVLEQRTLTPAPFATSLSTTSGKPGDVITISGSGFNATPSANSVSFGTLASTKAVVQSATTNQLQVVVPVGALYGPITITNTVTGLTSKTATPFNPVFDGGGRIVPASFMNKFTISTIFREGFFVGDIDGDGWEDFGVANNDTDDAIDIYRNSGLGGNLSAASFDAKVSVSIPQLGGSGTNGAGLWFADLDGDGLLDAVSSNSTSAFNSAFITLRNISTPGSIAFEAPEYWSGVTDETPINLITDLDGDGRPEILAGEGSGGSSSIGFFWANQNISTPGNIEFGAPIFPLSAAVPNGFAGATSGDLNGDGKTELIVSHNFGDQFTVLQNTSVPGQPTFQNSFTIVTGQYNRSMRVVDVNLDGKNDLVWKKSGGGIYIRINEDTDGTLTASDFATEFILTSDLGADGGITITDFNGDGKPDIALTDSDAVGVFENIFDGGSFSTASYIPAYQVPGAGAGSSTSSPVVSDLNHDGKPDFLIGGSASVTIVQNNNVVAPHISLNTVSPLSAPAGGTVTITGNNFSTVLTDNEVWFGDVRASVLTATSTQLTVTVPAGAAYAPVSVRRGEFSSSYHLPFSTSFTAGVTFNNTHFASPVTYTLSGANYDIEVGDLDLDGKPDIIAEGSGFVTSIFQNTHTSGAISSSSLTAVGTTGSSTGNPKLADVDGDGKLDIVSPNGRTYPNQSTTGTISFGTNITTASGDNVTLEDLNQDGKIDLASTAPSAGSAQLQLQENRSSVGAFVSSGTYGTFTSNIIYSKASRGGDVTIADFDNDGFNDIVSLNPFTDNMSVFRNTQKYRVSATLFVAQADIAVGDNPLRAYPADFDRDGKIDLLVSHNAGTSTTLLIVFQNISTVGNISFNRIDLTNPSVVTIATVADLDGDGKPEIIATSESGNRFSIYKNLHTSGALTAASFATPFNTTVTAPRGVTTGDLNLDGKPEIIITRAAGLLVVYENLISVSPPTISSFTPASGSIGTTVTITGTNFDPSPANNIVSFGAVRATVTSASTTQLTVTVPVGATHQPISVTSNNLIGYSQNPFTVSYSGGGSIDACSFSDPVDFSLVDASVARGEMLDVDGDGKTDLIVPFRNQNKISIFRNVSSPGTISTSAFAAPQDILTVNSPLDVVYGDLDADAKQDLVVINYNPFVLSIYKNQSTVANISFAAPVNLSFGAFGHYAAIADIDLDGKPEIIVSSFSSGILVLKNVATAGVLDASSFAAPITLTAGSNPQFLNVADLDGDGKPDIAVPNTNEHTVSMFRNTSSPGSISFATEANLITGAGIPPAGFGAKWVNTQDFDGDGKRDVFVTNFNLKTIAVFRNTSTVGSFSFSSRFDLNLTTTPSSPTFADLNGDGKTDLVFGGDMVGVFPNTSTAGAIGSSSFGTLVNFPSAINRNLAVGDVDGDGRPDIFTVMDRVSVLQNQMGLISPPTISSFTPSGLIGSTVTITGTNFTTPFANSLRFNGISATINSVTATTITATVPVGATSGPISLTIGCNTVTSATNFNVTAPPTISSFTPTSGSVGITVTITGTNFDATLGNNVVKFNGTEGYVTNGTTTSLTVIVPPGATTGPISIDVLGNVATSSSNFTVVPFACPPSTPTGGTLDTSFDPAVQVPSSFNTVKLQSNGKILAVTNSTTISGVNYSGMLRFNTNGTLDTSFGNPAIFGGPQLIVIQPDDKIISVQLIGNILSLNRFNSDGTPDNSFTGPSYDNSGFYDTIFETICLQGDGKILFSSYNTFNFARALTRLNSDGSTDASFVSPSSIADAMPVIKEQADGKILIGGPYGVIRLTSTGNIDPTFQAGSTDADITDLELQADGKIVVIGPFNKLNSVPASKIARLNTDGSVDITFQAGNGISGYASIPYDLEILPDRKIVVTGSFSSYNDQGRNYIAVINENGSLDCQFDSSSGPTNDAYHAAAQSDGKIVIAGTFDSYDGITRNGLARVNNILIKISITTQPSDFIACVGQTATFTTAATGTTNITYQWQFSSDGVAPFTDIANGGGYSNVTTATLSVNTTGNFGAGRYRCRINGDFAAEVVSNDEGLFINPIPVAPGTTGATTCKNGKVTLEASGATDGEYLWYTLPTGGPAITDEFNSTYLTPSLTATTTYYVSISKSGCESPRTPVVATVTSTACGPVFKPQTLVTQVEGKITIDLVPLITTSGTLDISSIRVTAPLNSGASAVVVAGVLTIDYKGKPFSGSETITIEACNTNGECNQQAFTIEVAGEIVVYNAVSPNGDDKNPFLFLQYIDVIRETKTNRVTIFNRWGDEVFSVADYDNKTKVFIGLTNDGSKLPAGTYFYKIELPLAGKSLSGFFDLKY